MAVSRGDELEKTSTLPWFVLLVVLGGCGPMQLPLGEVTGSVTLDGQPLSQAKVTFQPQQGAAASGITDAAGRYTLGTRKPQDGAVIGRHRVTITPVIEGIDLTADLRKVRPSTDQPVASIPTRYARPNTSGLTAEVKPGENQLDFDLKLDIMNSSET